MDIYSRHKWNKIAKYYDTFMLIFEKILIGNWRKKLISQIKVQKILEIGAGTGLNLNYYRPGVDLTLIDFSEEMLAKAKKRAGSRGIRVSFEQMNMENLIYEDNSFPAVVGSFVLCSTDDPLESIKEIRRVLTNDGRLLLLEHVRPKGLAGSLFDILNPLTSSIAGENINLDPVKTLRHTGFVIETEVNLFSNFIKLIVAKPLK